MDATDRKKKIIKSSLCYTLSLFRNKQMTWKPLQPIFVHKGSLYELEMGYSVHFAAKHVRSCRDHKRKISRRNGIFQSAAWSRSSSFLLLPAGGDRSLRLGHPCRWHFSDRQKQFLILVLKKQARNRGSVILNNKIPKCYFSAKFEEQCNGKRKIFFQPL